MQRFLIIIIIIIINLWSTDHRLADICLVVCKQRLLLYFVRT